MKFITLNGLESNLRNYTDQVIKPLLNKIPTIYFAYKNTVSDEIIYVSFDTVPNNADNAYTTGSLGMADSIHSTLGIQNLIRDGETSEFTKISDTSFSIKYEDKGVVTYEKLETSLPFILSSDIETNKEYTIDFNNFSNESINIEPATGKKAINGVTLNFSNYIDRLYAWKDTTKKDIMYTTFSDVSESNGIAWQTPGTKNLPLVQKDVNVSGVGLYVVGYQSNVYERYPDSDIYLR